MKYLGAKIFYSSKTFYIQKDIVQCYSAVYNITNNHTKQI